ncbi:DUF7144 family membrane protein [Actinoplanes sp. CA-030573]|uniref:DUF7144 family membrane protein n=1 Tax=Actinoplanes sp. CA-030573 TaxID=3239898 RepID=UPI003D8F9C45
MSGQSRYVTEEDDEPVRTGWVGVLVFGGLMLFLLGVFHVIQGIVALADDTFYIARKGDLVIAGDYTVWGWLHLVLGVVAIAAGAGIFTGAMWARVAGVVVAVLSALAGMLFMPAYPVWGVVAITFDVVVIYALVAHGGEVRGAKL